jgi:hypothetical protein
MRLNVIRSLAGGTFVILQISSIIEARAEKLNCSAYAAAAAAQNDQNVLQKCGFTGPAWSSDLSGHMKWCETANMGMLVKEDNARKNALAQCAQKPKLDQQACQSYAKAAVEHQIANKSQGCGFVGGGWSENYAAHFDWCLTANPAARASEGNARFQQLQGCFTAQKAAKKQACATYASTAVEQQKENVSRGCKFTGGLWSVDYAAHAKWCEGASKEASEKETQLRYAALKDECLKRICHWTRHCRGFPYFDCTTSTKCFNVPR